jgi:hypothetical protein
MNVAGTLAPEAAEAEGTSLALGGSQRLRRRGRPGESPAAAAALRGAGGWPAAGAPPRFPSAPPPRPHPAATPGSAWGWLPRRLRAALLVFGLLVAGAAEGCDLVPRHLRGPRAAGSAGASASSPAAAAGDRPALMTGEEPGGGGGWRRGGCGGGGGGGIPIFRKGPRPSGRPAVRRPRPVTGEGRGALAAARSRPRSLEKPPFFTRHPALDRLLSRRHSLSALRLPNSSKLSKQCSDFFFVLHQSHQGLHGTRLIFFFVLFLSC